MGSSSTSGSSIGQTSVDNTVISDAAGNSEQMLRRKVRENWKALHVSSGSRFRQDSKDLDPYF